MKSTRLSVPRSLQRDELYERPELARLRAASSRGSFRWWSAYSVGSPSRNQNHVGILMDELEAASVLMEFATEKFEDNAIGRLPPPASKRSPPSSRLRSSKSAPCAGISGRVKSGKPRPGQKAPYGYVWRDAEKSGYDLDPADGPHCRVDFQRCRRWHAAPSGRRRSHRERGSSLQRGVNSGVASTIHVILTESHLRRAGLRVPHHPDEEPVRPPHDAAPPCRGACRRCPRAPRLPLVDIIYLRANPGAAAPQQGTLRQEQPGPRAALLRAGYAKCGLLRRVEVATALGKGGIVRQLPLRTGHGVRGACRGALDRRPPRSTLPLVPRLGRAHRLPTVIGTEIAGMRSDDPTQVTSPVSTS